MKREELEKLTLETISSELYFDLADTIDSVPDEDLYKLIECKGDYEKEISI